MKILPIFLTLIVTCKYAASTCASDGSAAGNEVCLKTLSDAQVKFTLDQHKKMVEDPSLKGKNIFTSPYSIWEALTLTFIGARGQTSDDLATLLGYTGLDKNQLDNQFTAIKPKLESMSEDNVFKTANKIAFDKSIQLKQCVANNPLLEIGSVDFHGAPDVSRKLLNKWVENKTERKIKELLKPGVIKSNTLLVILNAVYFKGTWKTKFNQDQTKTEQFTTSADDRVPVEMMYCKSNYLNTYDADSKVSAISLPYVDEKYSMILMLPEGGNNDVDDLIGRLTPQKINTLLSKMISRPVRLWLPKLKMEEYYDLSKLVEDLGAKSIFKNSNMSGFVKTSPPMKVSQIVHQAFIDIGEEGSEAAAATAVIGGFRSGFTVPRPLIFNFNRPYVFMIRETQTGVILFMGVVKKPK